MSVMMPLVGLGTIMWDTADVMSPAGVGVNIVLHFVYATDTLTVSGILCMC